MSANWGPNTHVEVVPESVTHVHAWRAMGVGIEGCVECHDVRRIDLEWSPAPWPESEEG